MKLKDVFEKSVQFFKEKKIETARLDAELLIAHALKIDRVQLYIKYEQPLKESEISICRDYVRRRSLGEPVAYILNKKAFYTETFNVGPGVLIPRPETEALAEEALFFIAQHKIVQPKILDLGAGTGCVGLSIAKKIPEASLISIEKSALAFDYLKQNCEKLNLNSQAKLILADIENFDFSDLGFFDVIVSNPPYIDEADTQIEQNVKKFEPHEALFAKEKGLYFIKSWFLKSAAILKKPGVILFEIGKDQGPTAADFLKSQNLFKEIKILKDLSGLDRIIKCVP